MYHDLRTDGNCNQMKINEIINEDLVDTQKREWQTSTPYNLQKMGKRTMKGIYGKDGGDGGVYAAGTPDPKDPFMYRKKMRQPSILDKDAYYQYLKFVQPFTDENPFFPKVYNIDIKTDANGLQKPSYKMERLVSLDDASHQTGRKLDAILREKYFVDPHTNAMYDFEECIAGAARKIDKFYSNIGDEKLKEAIDLINYFIAEHPGFSYDLHRGNMMIRFAPGGPQLVFTDPVQDQGASIVGYNAFKGGWPERKIVEIPDHQLEDQIAYMNIEIMKKVREIANDFRTSPHTKKDVEPIIDAFMKIVYDEIVDMTPRDLKQMVILQNDGNFAPLAALPAMYADIITDIARKDKYKASAGTLLVLANKVRQMPKWKTR